MIFQIVSLEDLKKLGLYKGRNVSAPNISRKEVREKLCTTVTLRELCDDNDSLDNNKSPGPGIFNAWTIKAAKFAIETHLQFVFNNALVTIFSQKISNWLSLVRSTKNEM